MERQSEMQRRFGATIKVAPPATSDRQMFLILGKSKALLAGLVAGRGGKLLLGGPGWVLAEMSFLQAMSLRGVAGVRMVGGVSVNPDRLEFVRKLMEKDRNS
jgi:hypothetical protein